MTPRCVRRRGAAGPGQGCVGLAAPAGPAGRSGRRGAVQLPLLSCGQLWVVDDPLEPVEPLELDDPLPVDELPELDVPLVPVEADPVELDELAVVAAWVAVLDEGVAACAPTAMPPTSPPATAMDATRCRACSRIGDHLLPMGDSRAPGGGAGATALAATRQIVHGEIVLALCGAYERPEDAVQHCGVRPAGVAGSLRSIRPRSAGGAGAAAVRAAVCARARSPRVAGTPVACVSPSRLTNSLRIEEFSAYPLDRSW